MIQVGSSFSEIWKYGRIKKRLQEKIMRKQSFFKVFLLFFLILIFSLQGFSKEKIIASSWVTSPLTIDGSNEDWGNEDLNFEKKVDVDFAFRNDAENLYILFIFKDPKYLSSIDATGMTLWLNTEGKKKKNYGLTFIKKQVSADAFISILEQQKGTLSEEEENNIRANPRYFLHNIKVVGKEIEPASQQTDSEEASAALFRSMRQERMVMYEFAVPLNRVTEQVHGIGTEPGKIVKIGFEWGGLTEEMKKARAEGHEIPGTDAMRRGESADAWSKRSSGFSERSRGGQRPVQYSFWVDVQLAKSH
jgi:hypothetical protein